MKPLFSLLLLLLLLFTGCQTGKAPTSDPVPPSESTDADLLSGYLSLIESLESEILALKQENFLLQNGESNDQAVGNDPLPFEYEKTENGIVVTKYLGKETDLILPETVDGLPVVEISRRAFAENSSLRSVTLPIGVKKIGWFAFFECSSLVSVRADGVAEIAYAAFDGVSPAFSLIAGKGSYLEAYAHSFGISVKYP